ncbi:MAG: hypothetical protein QOH26_991 [Actinomycetota bacterium]|nr:hypothetical protein [Actinomycetota bacterium]
MDVNFGELMLWRWHRRKRAEATIAEGAGVLGLVQGQDRVINLDPVRKLEILEDLTGALEAKDPYTLGHSRRVARHTYRTAIAMGLTGHEIDELRRAATLHDVGKIRIPDRVLRKPGRLDSAERGIIQEHPSLGAEMVTGAAPRAVALAVRHHHERWDGAGYPDKLQGEEIPLFSRIICVADAFDAMTSARPYKPGCDRKTAIENLRVNAGYQFDPDVVEAFIRTLPAALPAAGALLFLAGPAPLFRKMSAWMKATGSGSVASAAGATGAAIIIGATGLGGTGGQHHRFVHPSAQAEVVVAESPSTDYGMAGLARLSVGLADAQASMPDAVEGSSAKASKRAGAHRKSGSRIASVSSAAKGGDTGGGAGQTFPGGRGDKSGGNGGDSKGASTDGGGTTLNPTRETDNNAVYDPKPGKGEDCSKDQQQDRAHCDR